MSNLKIAILRVGIYKTCIPITYVCIYIYIFIYIYIQGGLWHYVDRKNFYMGIMGTRRLRRHLPVPLIF